MADADLTIALTGVDQAIAGLEKLRLAGEGAFKGIANAANQSAAGGAGLGGVALERDLNRGTEAANRFREAIHILHPLLESAGLGIGNLGSFARVAGVGLGALGATLAGGAVIGLERLSDRLQLAVKGLKDLGASASDIEKLKGVSSETGTALGDLAKNYEAFIKARGQSGTIRFVSPPGIGGPPSGAAREFETLTKLFTLGAGTAAAGQEQQSQFLGALGPSGQITPKTIEGLSVGVARQIMQVLGITTLSGGNETPQQAIIRQRPSGISLPEFENRLNPQGPEGRRINQEFAARTPTLGDAFGKLETTVVNLTGKFDALAVPVGKLADLLGVVFKTPTPREPGEFAGRFRPQTPSGPEQGRISEEEYQALSPEERFRRRFEPRNRAPILPQLSSSFAERFGNFGAPPTVPALSQSANDILRLQGISGPITVPASSQGNISGYNANIDYRGGGQSSRSDAGGQEISSAGHAAGQTIADALISAAGIAGQIIKSSQGSLTDDLTQSSIARQTGQGAVPPSWYR